MSWSFQKIWNQSIQKPRERELVSREHIWASELNGSYIDRYLKMSGVKPTNPPNPRSLRKFCAGNLWEDIVKYLLLRTGLLMDSQEYLKYQYEGLLEVTGKLDFIAGGKPDYEKSLESLKGDIGWMPEFVTEAAQGMIEEFKKKYPDGLDPQVLEIKSCSAYMFDLYELRGTASPHHRLQTYHYLKSKKMKEGRVVYICKDDCRMLEVPVHLNDEKLETAYRKDIEIMTKYIRSKEMPPKEKFIVYNDEFGRFSTNFYVGYSGYLSLIYNMENQKEFDDKYKPIVEKWNRVLKRYVNGDTITDKNKEVLKEIKEEGFDVEKIKEAIKNEQE